ncbi:MAG: HD domain-containing phosphohydrolase [Gallionella sp.]
MTEQLEKLRNELAAAQRALAESEARFFSQQNELITTIRSLEKTCSNVERAHEEWMAALDSVSDPIFLHDENFCILRCNKAYQKLAGLPFKQITGQPYYHIFPKTNAPLPGCQKTINHGEESAEEIQFGNTIQRSRSFSIKDKRGHYRFSVHILENITEHRRLEKRTAALLDLSTSANNVEEKQLLQDGLNTIQHLTASNIGFLYTVAADQNEIELITWSSDTLENYCHAAFDKHYPVSDAGIWADCVRSREPVLVNNYETVINRTGLPHGHASLGRFISVPVLENNLVRMIVGVGNADDDYDLHDVETVKLFAYDLYRILQRQRSEKALIKSEEMLRESQTIAGLGSYALNISSGTWEGSDVLSQLLGIDETYERSLDALFALIHPDHRDKMKNSFIDDVLGQGKPFDKTYRLIRHSDQNVRWLHGLGKLEFDPLGRPVTMNGTIQDITDKKTAEISLTRANRALAALGEVNHSLVHATDEHQLLLAVCEAIVKQRGYRMAWVGYLEHDELKNIRLMAHAGIDGGYLELARIVWSDTVYGRGPSGLAARTGTTQVVQDFLTDDRMLPWRIEAAKRGYAATISLPLIGTGSVFGILTIYSGYADAYDQQEVKLLEEMADDLAFGVRTLRTRQDLHRARANANEHLAKLQENLEDTIKAIATIVEVRDPYTAGHQKRVAELALAIAREIGLSQEQAHGIYLAGLVHDLGKIKIPAEILSKPGRLIEDEYSLIKTHAQAGYDILKDIDFPWPIAQIVLQHHERLDGTGYPQGLKGDDISLEARILSVADVVEAMSSHRPYRPGLGVDAALQEITRGRGTRFDPQLVDTCVRLFKEQGYVLPN